MIESGQDPLGPFALYLRLTHPIWIGGPTDLSHADEIAWKGVGPNGVPIAAKKDAFVIFEFDKSGRYSGGAVPAYELPRDGRRPQHISNADGQRTELAYRRFAYMNAFLQSLYSAFATEQRTASQVQNPVNPMNYFKARERNGSWAISGPNVDYPATRDHNLEIETVNHAVQVLLACEKTFTDEFVDILSLTYTASHQYRLHEFSSAHLIAGRS